MAAGDVYIKAPASVANNAFMDLTATTAIVVHNIYYNGACEIYYSDGTNNIGPIDSDTAAGARLNLTHHCSPTVYVRVKNVSGGAVFMAADGMNTA